MLMPFTKQTPQGNCESIICEPIICACQIEKQVREVALVLTTKDGESHPRFHPICAGCFVARVTEGSA